MKVLNLKEIIDIILSDKSNKTEAVKQSLAEFIKKKKDDITCFKNFITTIQFKIQQVFVLKQKK